jgi:hypothetical protein
MQVEANSFITVLKKCRVRDLDWIHLAQHRAQRLGFVAAITKRLFHQTAQISLPYAIINSILTLFYTELYSI